MASGGVAILVKKKYLSKQIQIMTIIKPIETIQIQMSYNNTIFTFGSIYIPPNINTQIVDKQFQAYLNNIQKHTNIIFGGDINALHPIWDNQNRNNSRGDHIAQCISQSNLIVLNTGQQTRQNLSSNQQSAIDITCASNDIANKIDWDILSDNLGSDHLPILITLNVNQHSIIDNTKKRVQFTKLNRTLQKTSFDDTKNIEQFESKLQNIIERHTKNT